MVGCVVYTDGSARPTNPGFVGWGAHGYFYTDSPEDKPHTYEKNYLTPVGYIPVAEKKRVKKFVKPVDFFDFVGTYPELGSQNIGEMTALAKCLDKFLEYEVSEVYVLTDAEYVRNGFNTWMDGWAKNNWVKSDGLPAANRDIWEHLFNLKAVYKERKIKLTVVRVPAHTGELGNTQADALAGIGAHYSQAGIMFEDLEVVKSKKFLEGDVDKHPFINHRRIYFHTSPMLNQPGSYYQAESGGPDSLAGKRVSESAFAVIHLKEPDPIMEMVRNRQIEQMAGSNKVCMMLLDILFTKRVDRYLKKYGTMALRRTSKNQNVLFIDRTSLCAESSPVYLTLRAMEYIVMLSDILKYFRDEGSTGKHFVSYKAHDITDQLYEKQIKKVRGVEFEDYALKEEYVVGYKENIIKVQEELNGMLFHVPVPLVFGLDILPRNNLKRIEKLHPRIHLITWRETPTTLQYATIVECDDGHGIWSNLHATRIFLQHFAGVKT